MIATSQKAGTFDVITGLETPSDILRQLRLPTVPIGRGHFPVQQRSVPPVASDFAAIRTSSGVREMAWLVMGGTGLLFGIAYVTGPTSWSGLLAATISVLGSGLAVAVLSSGRVGVASFLIVGSVWTGGLVMVGAAGTQSPGPAMFLIALLLAAMLKSARAVAVVAGLSVVALLVILIWWPAGVDPWAREVMTARRYVIELLLFATISVLTVWWATHTQRVSREQERLAGNEHVVETLRIAMDSSRSGIAMCDENGTILYANRAALEMWDLSNAPSTVGGQAIDYWADQDAARDALQRMMQGSELLTELRARRADGTEFVVEVSGSRVDGPDGPALIGSFVDITERRAAEHQLRIERERTRAIVENTLDIVIILDSDGQILFENAAVERVLGFVPGERVGHNILEFAHPDDVASGGAGLGRLLTEPEALARVTMRFRHKDGSWRWLETVGRNMCDEPAIGGILGVGRDVTEQLEIKARLEATERLETVGRLAGGLAHDFNNLLTAIMGNAELAQRNADSDIVQRQLRGIIQASTQARELTRKLLGFARREQTLPIVIDLRASLIDMHGLLMRLLSEDIHLVTDAGEEPLPVLVDPVQFEQLLLNLAANARDAMPTGGTFTVKAERVFLDLIDPAFMGNIRPGAVVRVQAIDTGHGMPAEVASRVFEPFFTTKHHGRGTGLGLSMVYGSVVQAGGAIRLRSAPRAGTTFEILLPVSDGPVATLGRMPEHTLIAPDGLVLVAEDDAAVRALLHEVLVTAGCRVLIANDGAAGMALAEQHGEAIALLVTDVVMPNAGGMELATCFKRINPNGRVLFVTGYSPDPSLTQQAADMGATVLLKPFHVSRLLAEVQRVLA